MTISRNAAPHLFVDCDGERVAVDMLIEKYGTGVLPAHYEQAMEKYFNTTDKRVMMRKSLTQQVIPVMCPSGKVELVEKESGELVKRVSKRLVAKELIAIAKSLLKK